MDIATALATDLHEVAASLQLDPSGATAAVSMLTHNLRPAVRTYCGMELSTYVSDLPVSVTAFQPLVRRDDIVTFYPCRWTPCWTRIHGASWSSTAATTCPGARSGSAPR